MKIEYRNDNKLFDWENPFYFTIEPKELTAASKDEFAYNLKIFAELEDAYIMGSNNHLLSMDIWVALKTWAYNCSQLEELNNSVIVVGRKSFLSSNGYIRFVEIGIVDFENKKGMKLIEIKPIDDNYSIHVSYCNCYIELDLKE